MSITVEEKYNGRNLVRGNGGSATIEYIVSGTDDDIQAVAALEAVRPLFWDNLPIQTSKVEPLTQTIWLGTVNYGYNNSNVQDALYSFDTTGGNQHITQSLATLNSYAPSGKNSPDFEGAIGVDDNSVNGVDITVPVYAFSETYYKSSSIITTAFKRNLFLLTGQTNASPWREYNAGEVLFLGVSGSRRGRWGDWELQYKFAASPNITNKTIGSITGISKKGWDYLWVRYEKDECTVSKSLIQKPTAVYIEQVYQAGDFSLLGIS